MTRSTKSIAAFQTLLALLFPVAAACGPGPRPPLHDAAFRGDAEEVIRLLHSGAEIEGLDDRGDTPLISAVFSGNLRTVKALLDSGADVLAQAHGGRIGTGMRPLDFAVQRHDYPMVKYLLSRGANVGCREPATFVDQYPALHLAAILKDKKMVEILVQGGCQRDAQDKFGDKPGP
jgi:ankyrin repeat protein